MVGTMNHLEGNPRPLQGGEEVSLKDRAFCFPYSSLKAYCDVYLSFPL